MLDRGDLIYRCDGGMTGLLCCVFESYTRKEIPADILGMEELTLFPVRDILPDEAHALRVWKSVGKISRQAQRWVALAWLSCEDGRLYAIYRFIRLLYTFGSKTLSMLADDTVNRIYRMVRAVENEAHHMKEFLRFAEYEKVLVSVISPKGAVLPLLQHHFTDRFPEEAFVIFDRTHGMALFYRPYQAYIQTVESLQLPPAGAQEQEMQALWKRYYEKIAIAGRFNPKCRMGHCPKRFWPDMTELAPELLKESPSRQGLPAGIAGTLPTYIE